MKRRTNQSSDPDRPPAPDFSLTETVSVPSFTSNQAPVPPALARWMGSLFYWVTSLGGQYYATVVATLGLTPGKVAVLQVLSDETGIRQARLTDRTQIDKATMVGLLNELEAQGLIERRAAPHDRRAFDVYLTERGSALVQQVAVLSEQAEEEFYGVLSAEERQTLRAMLTRLMNRTAE